MITSIDHTGLTVSDLDAALSFYRDALGLELMMQQEKEGGYLAAITGYPCAHVRMAHLATPDGGRLELYQYVEPQGSGSPLDPSTVGITHVCLVVEDIHAATEGSRRRGRSRSRSRSRSIRAQMQGPTVSTCAIPTASSWSCSSRSLVSVVVVTGGMQGIGAAIAEAFARQGYRSPCST